MDRKEEVCLNKVRYESKEKAMNSYNNYRFNMQRNRGRRVKKEKHKQRPYKCDNCGGWHLTTIR